LLPLIVSAQPRHQWVHTYDTGLNLYDRFYDIYHNDDNSFTLCGWAHIQYPNWYQDIWVVRIDNGGGVMWSERYGVRDRKEISSSIIQTDGGGFFIGGTRTIPGNFQPPFDEDFVGLLTDAEGNQEWMRYYGEEDGADICHAVIETKADNFLMVGYTYFEGGDLDGYVVCVGGDGDVLWARHYGGEERERFYGIRETDNGFVLAGRIGNNDTDIWIVKIDNDGDVAWSRRHGGDSHEDCRVIVSVPGGFILGGGYRDNEEYDCTSSEHLGQIVQ